MILSVSRRTDVPCFYSDWFLERLEQKYVCVRNPMNYHQVSRIDISPEVVDCIVFWTKNPMPMMEKLDRIQSYPYYFQYTITGYGGEVEPGVPDKKSIVIPTFKALSSVIGARRILWRYDPIFFSDRYTYDYHVKAFGQIAAALEGYTNKVIVSFIDLYDKTVRNTRDLNIVRVNEEIFFRLAIEMSKIAASHNMEIESCAEEIDLDSAGIKHGHCMDQRLIEDISDAKIVAKKDASQRKECGCIESIDIGSYNTCKNGCKYCYANYSNTMVENRSFLHDVHSPLIFGNIEEADKVTERKVKSLIHRQMTVFDYMK